MTRIRPAHERTRATLLFALLLILLPGLGRAEGKTHPATPVIQENPIGLPGWVTEHFESLTEGGGRWIAENPYKSDQEPDDAYGLEWTWGLGRQTVTGRLFGIRDGQDIATYWQFRAFWHTGERALILQQFGANGAFGTGPMRELPDGSTEVVQEFFAPDGSASRVKHISVLEGETRHDSSLNWADGDWAPSRSYTWHLDR